VLSPTRYPYRIYILRTDTDVVVLHIHHTSRRILRSGELIFMTKSPDGLLASA
jgi:hypothetical protein